MRILIVEDEVVFLGGLVEALVEEGHEAVAASTFEKAQAIIAQAADGGGHFDAIIFDGHLDEGKTSLELIALAAGARLSDCLIAASDDCEMIPRMLEAGCTERCDKMTLMLHLRAKFPEAVSV